ncbi:Methyltransferase domain-containing protein [Rubrivivax sp. A210]|uniref:class I SAM-dependent methyltransferase n=1 Tax=Rubrivivax sp. A210 TaxID=2772301 RepID=UPI001917CA2A|nr:class I SAM-dependent methyltransferase [Rubrivivax sp. A210]CAD5372626.1 Methyltransferase domain-containing protein [Rubrivivax sp. A210]
MSAHDETRAVAERYGRRAPGDRYHPLQAAVWQERQGRQRALIDLLRRHAPGPVAGLRVLEVGCGHGDNLLELLQLGFQPENLVGNELLPARAAAARQRLPAATAVLEGDALAQALAPGSFDIVLQSTVFSSLLDDAFQQRLAAQMWQWLKPGGAVLWYDFTVNNPRNPDVRGVSLARVQALFPQAQASCRRVTLAPPLARALGRWHPALIPLFNTLPFLRTHLLAWLAKPGRT